MKSRATFVAGFVVFIFQTTISAVCPHQLRRPHRDERRRNGPIGEEDIVVQPTMNWTPADNQRVPVITLDINRDYHDHLPLFPSTFPTAQTETTRTSNRKKRHNCVHNFCEEADNYPEDIIKRVLGRTSVLDSYFKNAEVAFELNNRGGFDEEEDTTDAMCPVKSVTMYPRTAKNTKKEDKFLVNVEGHRQGIVFEICLAEGTCRFSDAFPVGYVSSCKQKYTKRSLAVLDANNQTTAWDSFEVPSCCVCVVKRKK